MSPQPGVRPGSGCWVRLGTVSLYKLQGERDLGQGQGASRLPTCSSTPSTPFPELCSCKTRKHHRAEVTQPPSQRAHREFRVKRDISTSLGGWPREQVPGLPPAPLSSHMGLGS